MNEAAELAVFNSNPARIGEPYVQAASRSVSPQSAVAAVAVRVGV